MSKTPEAIQGEIQRLKDQLAGAKKAEIEKKERVILRAARRAGLPSLNWNAAQFEGAFRKLTLADSSEISQETQHDYQA